MRPVTQKDYSAVDIPEKSLRSLDSRAFSIFKLLFVVAAGTAAVGGISYATSTLFTTGKTGPEGPGPSSLSLAALTNATLDIAALKAADVAFSARISNAETLTGSTPLVTAVHNALENSSFTDLTAITARLNSSENLVVGSSPLVTAVLKAGTDITAQATAITALTASDTAQNASIAALTASEAADASAISKIIVTDAYQNATLLALSTSVSANTASISTLTTSVSANTDSIIGILATDSAQNSTLAQQSGRIGYLEASFGNRSGSGVVSTWVPIVPTSDVEFFGDSITYGVGLASNSDRYSDKLSAYIGSTFTNYAVIGDNILDFNRRVYDSHVSGKTVFSDIGINDWTNTGVTDAAFGLEQAAYEAALLYLSLPSAKIVNARLATVASGTWASSASFANIGLISTSSSASLSTTVTGRFVLVALSVGISATSSFRVIIDGVSYEQYPIAAPWWQTGNSGILTRTVFTYIHDTLAPGTAHTVVVVGGSSGELEIDYFAGFDYGEMANDVFAISIDRSDFPPGGPSPATLLRFAEIIRFQRETCLGLRETYGARTWFVDASRGHPLGGKSVDGLHLNPQGHAYIKDRILHVLASGEYPSSSGGGGSSVSVSSGGGTVNGTFSTDAVVFPNGGGSPLSYYKEDTTSFSFTGIRAATVTVEILRVGSLVTLQFPPSTGDCSLGPADDYFHGLAANLAVEYRPKSYVIFNVPRVMENSNWSAGAGFSIMVNADGTSQIYQASGTNPNFAKISTCGWDAFAISYTVQ